MPRGRKSPAARGVVRSASPYTPQQDEDESGQEMQQVGARRWTRVHGQDQTCLPEMCWRIVVIVGLVLTLMVAVVSAVFAILAWSQSDEIATSMAKLSQVEDMLATGLGLPIGGNQTA